MVIEVTVRVYGPLNDFLSPGRRHVAVSHAVAGHPAVKDLIEGVGVPHPEIDLILVNGQSVAFDYAVQRGDRIAVFPPFATLDIGALTRVRPAPLDAVRFAADVHLGKLARYLRLIGLDTAYRRDTSDRELAQLAHDERRILLTRDHGLLKRRVVTHGYFVRDTNADRQLAEVVRRFAPMTLAPFSRCLRCNAELHEVPKAAVDSVLLPRTSRCHDHFQACSGCGGVYWQGSHWKRLTCVVGAAQEIMQAAPSAHP